MKYDGFNIVEFGPLGGGALGLNYIWYQSGKILEADLTARGERDRSQAEL